MKTKIRVVAKDRKKLKEINVLLGNQFVLSNRPELVVSYGGDGTALIAERRFPGVPKLLLKDSKVCNKCFVGGPKKEVFEKVVKKAFEIMEIPKLEMRFKRKRLIAFNDINIRNVLPTAALRFAITVNNKVLYKEVIGDGVVIATIFGSEGYFKSVSGRVFEQGFGIAFNNPTEKIKPIFLRDDCEIRIDILRGDAVITADNQKKTMRAKEKDYIIIGKHAKPGRIIHLK